MALLSAGLIVLQALVYHHSPVMTPSSEFIPHQTLGLSFLFHSSPPSALHTPLMGGGNVSVSFPQTLSCLSLPSLTQIAVLEPDIIKKMPRTDHFRSVRGVIYLRLKGAVH